LSLLHAEKTEGLVIDIGDGFCHTVPFYGGYSLPHATYNLDFGGRDLTEYLQKILLEKNLNVSDIEIIRDIKEKLCYVSQDYDSDMVKSSSLEKSYLLPNGQTITLDKELFRCPENFFSI